MTAAVVFGVAGWSYEDWKGVVYPRGCKDTLRAVAERVDLVEVNSTFYAMPSAKNCAAWVARTEDLGTRFTAKLPQEFTHARRFDAATIARARDGFAPLAESGMHAVVGHVGAAAVPALASDVERAAERRQRTVVAVARAPCAGAGAQAAHERAHALAARLADDPWPGRGAAAARRGGGGGGGGRRRRRRRPYTGNGFG